MKQAGEIEPGFTRKTVKWAITCTQAGRFTGVVPFAEGKGRVFERCPNLSHPELVGGESARAHFLVEGLPTAALYWKDDLDAKDQKKFRAKHAFFLLLLDRASQQAPYLAGTAALLKDVSTLPAIHAALAQQKAKSMETARLSSTASTLWNAQNGTSGGGSFA